MKSNIWGLGAICAGLALTGFVSAGAQQQQSQQQQQRQERGTDRDAEARPNSQQQRSEQTLTIPPQEGLLRIRAVSPKEVRVGASYDYEIHVSNMSQDMMLHNVTIRQENAEGFQIESSEIQKEQVGQAGRSQNSQAGAQPRANGQQQAARQQRHQQQREQQQVSAEDSEEKSEASQGQQKDGEWTIAKLAPGETRVIKVTAASDEEGSGNLCVAVTSFTPSLCLQTKFVKPELEIVKRAPEKANLCQPIEFEYFVKNAGSGDLPKFTVTDELSEGLQTATGDNKLEFAVDGLKAGDTRKFVAKLQATKAGEFASRAVAKLADGEETRSSRTTTRVEQADLAVEIEGPERTYVNRPAHYTVRVTNNGNIAANDAKLALQLPGTVRLVDAGKPKESRHKVSRESSSVQQQKQPTPAEQGNAEQAQQQQNSRQQAQQQQQAGQRQQGRMQTWDLGDLKPNQTMQVSFTVRASEGESFEPRAIAQFVCGENRDQPIRSMASTETQILSLPALAIAVVDNEDPVELTEQVVYTVVVENEGTAPDSNVQVGVELPEGLEFVEATGTTEAQADGQTVTFEPVEELAPGKRVTWKVTTKAKEDGNVRFRATLKSENQEDEAIAEEPTRLIEATAAGKPREGTRRE